MADEEKKILVSTEVEVSKESTQALQTLSTSLFFVVNGVDQMINANMRLVASDISVRNAEWGVVDAQRARLRLSIQQVELDRQQAELSLELAQRQLAITMRTGRRLDVEQAQLNVMKANRDMQLTIFDIETQRVATERGLISSAEQYQLALKYQEASYRAVLIQIGTTIVQTEIMIGLLITKIGAMITERAIASGGATLAMDLAIVGAAAGVAAAATVGIYQAVKPDTKPSSGPTYNNTTTSSITVQGNMDQSTYDYIRRREGLDQMTGGGTRRRTST